MLAIVVTFDRLATRLVGCYGNEWIETPNFDRLAATATVFDNQFTDSVGPRAGRAWLTGRHAFGPSTPVLGQLLRDAGVTSHLLASEISHRVRWETAGFDHVKRVAGADGLEVTPGDVPIARLVQAGNRLLREAGTAEARRLIWLHAPAPGLPPEGFATLYFEDFEERGLPLTDVPREEWSQQIAVAAGSMSLVDHWVGELLSQVKSRSPAEPALVLIGAARGQGWLDPCFTPAGPARQAAPVALLSDQETKSPLLLSIVGDDRFAEFSSLRCQRFTQSTDLLPTLLDWFGSPVADQFAGRSLLKDAVSDQPPRTTVCYGDDDRNLGIQTPDWKCLIRLADADQQPRPDVCFGDSDWPEHVQLFSKPEDIWDVADLATQQPEICEDLVRRLQAFRRSQLSGASSSGGVESKNGV